MGRYVRIDRRYSNPYRLTGLGYLVVMALAVVVALCLTTRSVIPAVIAAVGLATVKLVPLYVRGRVVPPVPTMPGVRGAPGERYSRHIPGDVKEAVRRRDGGACVTCGSIADIQFDHKIPWSRGGTATVNNIQLLCGPCNRRKSAKLLP